jgi:hypothetical protein
MAIAALFIGCSGTSGRGPVSSDSGSQQAQDAALVQDQKPSADMPAHGAKTCQQVVMCWHTCANESCIQDCFEQGNKPAQKQVETLDDCLSNAGEKGKCSANCINTQDYTACDSCLAKECAAPLETCDVTVAQFYIDKTGTTGNLTCKQVVACWEKCTDYVCGDHCYYQGTAASQKQVDAIDSCSEPAQEKQCASVCTDTDDYTACDACLDKECAAQFRACGVSAGQYYSN